MQPRTVISVKRTATDVSTNVRLALWLIVAMIPFVAVAAGAGLFFFAIYHRNPASIIPALQGQDLVTLLLLPGLGGALWGVWRGSTHATLIWIGLLGYMFYTYTGAAVGYYFAEFTLIYIALFSLSGMGHLVNW